MSRWHIISRWFRKVVLCFLLYVVLWAAGLLWFGAQVPTAPTNDHRHADAIVTLTGGSGRLEHGLQLLADGKGKALFISGVRPGTAVSSLLRSVSPSLRQALDGRPNLPIALGHQAENTIGNAEETAQWLAEKHFTSIRLVTSNYHMPRSVSEFKATLPGITIIPDPVFADNQFPASSWWRTPENRAIVFSEYHKFLASKLRHWLVALRIL